jgi:hypothetical protein
MPHVQNPSYGSGASPLLVSNITLTAAQLNALNTSPPTLIAAPGAGKLIVPFGFAQSVIFGTVALTTGVGTTFGPNYSGIATALIPNGTLFAPGQVFSSKFIYTPSAFSAVVALMPGADNTALVLNGADNFGGAIATSSLGAGGTGYAMGDTGTITTGNGDATYEVLTVGALGAVLTYSITAPGTGYVTGAGQATATGGAQPGVGINFTINVNSIKLPDCTMRFVTYYQIIPVP